MSTEAKDMIVALLNVDPTKRLTADQALRHSWLEKGSDQGTAEEKNLAESLVRSLDPRRDI